MTRLRATMLTVLVAFALAAPAEAGNLGSAGGFSYSKAAKKTKDDVFDVGKVAAKCPGGTVPVGGGQSISSNPNRSFIGGFYPLVGNRWGAELWNYEIDKRATASAWAVCTKQTSKVTNGTGTTSTFSAGPKFDQTSCDGSVTGGGYFAGVTIDWYTVAVFPSNYPSPGGDPDALDGLSVTTQHLFEQNDTITRYAICMKGGKPKYPTAKKSGKDPVTARVYCPKKTSVTSGGYVALSDDDNDAFASTSKPIDSKKDSDKVPDDGWQVTMSDFDPGEMTVEASAICR